MRLLPLATKRLGRAVQFGTLEQEQSPMRYMNNCCAGFGQTPSVPTTIPKPEIPGYVTAEACQAQVTRAVTQVNEDMKPKHIMLAVGGLAVGAAVGMMLGKR